MIYAGHLVAYTCSLKCLAPYVQRYPNFSDNIGKMGLFLLGFTCRLPHTAIYRAFVRGYSNFSNCFGQMPSIPTKPLLIAILQAVGAYPTYNL